MHPYLFQKFAGTIQLNQKFHPNMTGKYFLNHSSASKTPMNESKKEYMLLQTPVQPKPPSFFEQAYLGKEDPRRKNKFFEETQQIANRPYSAYRADDKQGYMSHHRLKQQMEKQKQTLDPRNFSRTKKIKKKEGADEEWERFNEDISVKSGHSRRTNNSHHSRMSNRVKSAAGLKRIRDQNKTKERVNPEVNLQSKVELTQQNLRDFEEKLSSKAPASRRREKIVFSSKGEQLRNEKYDGQEIEQKEEGVEGEGDEIENPNEAENNQQLNPDNLDPNAKLDNDEGVSLLSRDEIKSLSKASRQSYVESLRNELRREREKRNELEKQVQQLIDAKKQ